MSLRGTYAYSVDMAQKLGFDGTIEERDGKLRFKGTVGNQADANKIWDAIKTIPTWSQDVVADIQAKPGAAAARESVTKARMCLCGCHGDGTSQFSPPYRGLLSGMPTNPSREGRSERMATPRKIGANSMRPALKEARSVATPAASRGG